MTKKMIFMVKLNKYETKEAFAKRVLNQCKGKGIIHEQTKLTTQESPETNNGDMAITVKNPD
jgi:hypothetical protein